MKSKSAWQNAKDLITQYAIDDLKTNYGIEAPPVCIAPKAYRDSPDHVLFFTEEFKGEYIYVLYKKDYKTFCDERGNVVDKPIYYQLDKTKVPGFVYDKVPGTSDKSYCVPVEHLHKLTPIITEVFDKIEDSFVDAIEPDDDKDENISTMTLRDFYAIVQNKPVSNKTWLNNLIKKEI